MNKGYLKQYFDRIASKRLRGVEVNPSKSHQHEFNGNSALKSVLGETTDKIRYKATFMYLNDDDNSSCTDEACVTWYDSRTGNAKRAAEYRLYFAPNEVMKNAQEGDLLIISLGNNNSCRILVIAAGTTVERQILWLFDLQEPTVDFTQRYEPNIQGDNLEFVSTYVLEQLGIPAISISADDELLDGLLQAFPSGFPTTRKFSEYAREKTDISSEESPDNLLLSWMNMEQKLFETFERHIVKDRLHRGFQDDIDEFISFSLSVQNRRKSRAGHAFENHLEHLFILRNIRYTRGGQTENRSRPDFLFPGICEYHDDQFNMTLLTMLGVKTTCKDRWRQILVEAARIPNKHCATIEPGISQNQTDEMASHNLQLVIPKELHSGYSEIQKHLLMSLEEFLHLVENKQVSN